jgi:pyocin large subunit-like protein
VFKEKTFALVSYYCGVFVCLYAAHIAIQKHFTFTQADIDDVRMWMVHLMDVEGRNQNGGHRWERSETLSDFEDGLGYQPQKTGGRDMRITLIGIEYISKIYC